MKIGNQTQAIPIKVATACWHPPSKTMVAGLRALGIPVEAVDQDDDEAYKKAGFAHPGFVLMPNNQGTPQRPQTTERLRLSARRAPPPQDSVAMAAAYVMADDARSLARLWASLTPSEQRNMFCCAATVGAEETAAFCAEKLKGDLDGQDGVPAGNTAMHYAAFSGHSKIVEMLLAKGARFNVLNPVRTQPMHDAARSGSHGVLRVLGLRGAALTEANVYGDSLLHRIAAYADTGHEKDYLRSYLVCVHAYKKANPHRCVTAYVNMANKKGFTALDWAVANGQSKLAAALLLDGAEHSERWTQMMAHARTPEALDHSEQWQSIRDSLAPRMDDLTADSPVLF